MAIQTGPFVVVPTNPQVLSSPRSRRGREAAAAKTTGGDSQPVVSCSSCHIALPPTWTSCV
ncbi:hypothetical protein NHJ6243_002511 [Beauveria neobassiana]